MKELYIIGSGGFGREVAWLVERVNQVNPLWNLVGFIDDNPNTWGLECNGYKVLGGTEILSSLNREVWVVCAVGAAKTRKMIIDKINNLHHVKFATLVDPSVISSDRVKLGEGTIICAGTILTVNIQIGKHVIVNLDCTLGHDDIIEDYVTVYPSVNISGNVNVGELTELGTGSKIIQGVNISRNVILGAGAVVSKSLQEPGTYVGVPVRRLG
ncbi:acetyltransferase [Pseudoflavonifractor sp. An85]|uniref:acetyltransferase n=1 Tax=Pseudoflavonifractor sp. An85 TaxID=1965661 RepID=UPI000B3A26E4|nr:acetyltransferase [Pseudoflavonifractor sp. An85]